MNPQLLAKTGNRRTKLVGAAAATALAGLGIWLACGASSAQAPDARGGTKAGSNTVEPLTELKVVERVRAATTRGLNYLQSKQNPNGSWHQNNAVNALALLAFMGRGHTP